MTRKKNKKNGKAAKDLQSSLLDVKTKDGVEGYILRKKKSATVNMNDAAKLSDLAYLSSSAFEAGEKLSKTFDLGEIQNVVVEGEEIKVLSLVENGSKISVFMKKKVDHDKIRKNLAS